MDTFAICSLAIADWTAGAVVWLTVGPVPGGGRFLPLGLLPIAALLIIAFMAVRRRRRNRTTDRSGLDHLDAMLDDDRDGR